MRKAHGRMALGVPADSPLHFDARNYVDVCQFAARPRAHSQTPFPAAPMSAHPTLPALVLAAGLFAPPAAADDPPPPLRVADVRAVAGDWIVLRADTEGRVVRWKALDRGLRLAPPELALRDPRTAVATAARPGRYRVVCVTARGDVPSEIVEFVVTVEADAPDPPGPGPPEPTDPVARRVRDAFASDPGEAAKKREYVIALAGFYAAMAKHVQADQAATVGDLLSDYRAAIPAVLPDDAVPATRKACGEEVASVAGADPDRKIDPALKSKLVDLFTRLASALDALKGK